MDNFIYEEWKDTKLVTQGKIGENHKFPCFPFHLLKLQGKKLHNMRNNNIMCIYFKQEM